MLRSGVSPSEADEAAGGELHTRYLPVPAASEHRDMVARSPSPYVAGLDYFVFGKKKNAPYEGFLLMIQPYTYFIVIRRVKSRSARVSYRETVGTFRRSSRFRESRQYVPTAAVPEK